MSRDRGQPRGVPSESAMLSDILRRVAALERVAGSGTMQVGDILYTGRTTPGAKELLCNGAAIPAGSEYDALRDIYGTNVPDLRDRFPVGAGGSYAVGATGGANTVALSIAEMPSHNHGGSTGNQSVSHTHTTNVSHQHNATGGSTGNGFAARSAYVVGGAWGAAADSGVSGGYWSGTQTGGATIGSVASGNQSASHNHSISAQGSGTAHENRPPYYALTPMVRAIA